MLIHPRLREVGRHGRRGGRVRAVRLPRRLEPRAVRHEARSASRSPTTTRERWRSSGSDAPGTAAMPAHVPVMTAEVLAALAAGARRAVRGLHGRPRRPRARAARGGRDAAHRARSRRRRRWRSRARRSRRGATASSWCTRDYRDARARARRARHRGDRRRARGSRRVVAAARRRGARLQLPARRAARHADGHEPGPDGRRPDRGRRASGTWPT